MNIDLLIYSTLISVNFSILLFVCFFDGKYRKIPNNLNKIALAFSIFVALYNGYLMSSLPTAALCFIVFFILWYIGVIGAGDVKLLFALIIGIQPELVTMTLIFIGFLGGFLVSIMYVIGKMAGFDSYKKGIPYGMPIALSCFIFSTVSILSN
ncbi:prepilin peptidase CpaA [Vibrio crassostreae]|uniref:Membrane protein n=2 Tax=Vibrio crassostreae TaxID=246167 RepID=A0A0T7D911_9VIBR|nr:A24 family peptidase [Vibrio crassostreae]NOH77118.1 prepilin peptidase [Vibrio crassostreae]NOI54954.1 prepilin peptidase [Vibrio crassostreae]ROO50221.1 prepilin peptidase CpaA [Vibrio crassostreae]ROO65662.1 prepilin peptidase CpaA [Vibrio crassostreae]ROO72013.1 prepilin peptidase CpaA [Vibrio crassostreae]